MGLLARAPWPPGIFDTEVGINMTNASQNKAGVVFRVLTLVGMGLLVAIFFSPIWWVSLKAPNYPPQTFPDGVRIHFHVNGVFNGCQTRESDEVHVEEALDCVHEMNTINHFIGMQPMDVASAMLAFAAIFFEDLKANQSVSRITKTEEVDPLILAARGAAPSSTVDGGASHGVPAAAIAKGKKGDRAQNRLVVDLLGYKLDLAVLKFQHMAYVFTGVGVLLAVFMVYGGPLWWLPAIPAVMVPVGFLADYVAWLWWFGHNLSSWGAFTVKPFMPTVFGQGKVAQFGTFSYPHYGFGLMVLLSVITLLAILIRRKQLREANGA